MKKFLLILLGIVLTLPAFSQETFSYEYEGQTVTYKILDANEKTCEVQKGYDISGPLVLPAMPINGSESYKLIQIGMSAFYGCSEMSSIEMPNSVTRIELSAFYNCKGLKTVQLPPSLTSIGFSAFYGCSGLETLSIPSSVTDIGATAFASCSKLERVDVDENNSFYRSIDGVLFNKVRTILECYPAGREGSYSIPNTVRILKEGAFSGCYKLKGVEIPNSLQEIGNRAFSNCGGIESLELPNTITKIGYQAFANCSGLKSVHIPNSLPNIDDCTFDGCSGLKAVDIPNSVTTIGINAFRNCWSLETVYIPNSIISIGSHAFMACKRLQKVFYNTEDPITAEENVFINCPDEAILYVPYEALDKCSITSPWMYFKDIQAFDFADVNTIVADELDSPCEIYTLDGVKAGVTTDGLHSGIYILRQGSKVKKIAVK